ncbi:acyltransferase family protein [Clostridium sp. AM58-1XD]|uniref:acyltransferase family protein n=1 Tax=Clostridium sp. AM58-1XD TaxID=2292307 RepID=UPI000E551702|nr:acyltransferase family protein [Clostridium sp. AM58-1XD]RGY94785.1 hypothetical protein DXA13_20350 [Clostridium sp. AM58-1XD]
MIRENNIDNIKILLLFTVAFAHNLIPFKNESKIIEFAIKFIYLFHMPLFTFCTGYLVRKSKRNVWKYIKKLLIPYIVFQLLYMVIGAAMIQLGIIDYSTDTMKISIVEPSGPLYFLICMVFWRMLYPTFDHIKANKIIVLVSMAIGAALLSLDKASNTMILPCFALLPFFYAGSILDDESLGKLRDIFAKNPWYLFLLGGGYIILALIVPYDIILFRANAWNLDTALMFTLALKLLYYIIAFLGGAVIIGAIPRKNIGRITQKASNGMVIYIGSSFLSPYLYIILYHMCPILGSSLLLNSVCIFIFTIVTIVFLSWNRWTQFYEFIFERFI